MSLTHASHILDLMDELRASGAGLLRRHRRAHRQRHLGQGRRQGGRHRATARCTVSSAAAACRARRQARALAALAAGRAAPDPGEAQRKRWSSRRCRRRRAAQIELPERRHGRSVPRADAPAACGSSSAAPRRSRRRWHRSPASMGYRVDRGGARRPTMARSPGADRLSSTASISTPRPRAAGCGGGGDPGQARPRGADAPRSSRRPAMSAWSAAARRSPSFATHLRRRSRAGASACCTGPPGSTSAPSSRRKSPSRSWARSSRTAAGRSGRPDPSGCPTPDS